MQESGVETAEAASQEDHQVVPMADSLVERAKQVVETNFVDEEFAVRRLRPQGGCSEFLREAVAAAAAAPA